MTLFLNPSDSVSDFSARKGSSCHASTLTNVEATRVNEPPLAGPSNSNNEKAAEEEEREEKEEDSFPARPTKRLRDLRWPEPPQSDVWDDPLKKDEPKPLRPFELEAIGTWVFYCFPMNLQRSLTGSMLSDKCRPSEIDRQSITAKGHERGLFPTRTG
jgi:hypothetical protein